MLRLPTRREVCNGFQTITDKVSAQSVATGGMHAIKRPCSNKRDADVHTWRQLHSCAHDAALATRDGNGVPGVLTLLSAALSN